MGMNGKITLVSNKGEGSTRKVTIAEGMTAQEVLYAELGIQDPDKWLVVLNGSTITNLTGHPLHDGDFIIIVPTNVKTASKAA